MKIEVLKPESFFKTRKLMNKVLLRTLVETTDRRD
jgi:hypothetical protein